jgi:chitinase
MRSATVLLGTVAVAVYLADFCPGIAETSAVPTSTNIIAGYFASWKELRTKDIPAKRLSYLLYAFGSISAAGLAQLSDPCIDAGQCDWTLLRGGGNFASLKLLKRDNPHLRILISLGGWNGSRYFSDAASTAQSRERFSRSIIEVFFLPYP